MHCQHPRYAPDDDLTSIVKDLAIQVSEIAKEIKIMKTLDMNHKHDKNSSYDDATNKDETFSPNTEQPTPSPEPEADTTPSNGELNESFASIEEFMDAETNEDVLAFLDFNQTTQP